MKRAIYLDDRERELARRVLAYVVSAINYRIAQGPLMREERFGLLWTRDEIIALEEKFAEPDQSKLLKPKP